jgi:acyl carrier protein
VEKLRKIISEQLGVDEGQITEGSHFKDDLNADPLSMADLVVNIEENYNIKIPPDELMKFNTVGDVANFLADNMTEV